MPSKESNIGEAFAWNGSPLTQDELVSGQTANRYVRSDKSLGQSPGNSNFQQKAKLTRDDWDDVSKRPRNCSN